MKIHFYFRKSAIVSMIVLISFTIYSTAQENGADEQPVKLKLMTYNLKFASSTFKPSWEDRRDMQVDLIKQYDPDIVGTQEGLKEQIDYLMDKLPEYIVVGEGRQGGDDDEHMAIFIKKDKFRLRELQSFQLSNTPEIIGSGPEVNPRMVTWVRLAMLNKTEEGKEGPYPEDYRGHWENTKEFYIFNTHFFNGRDAGLSRYNASILIQERISELKRFGEWDPDRPVFLMGDFNCRPGSAPYNTLVRKQGPGYSDKLFDTSYEHDDIDWILYRGQVKVLHYEEVDYNVDGVKPSDHDPIYVEVELENR